MKDLAVLFMILTLVSCAGAADSHGPREPLNPATPAVARKTVHGYVVGGDPERFGGFIGDCASHENFPFYWLCQSENSGNDFH